MGTSAAIRVLHLAPDEQCGSGIARYAARFRDDIGRAGVHVEVLSPRLDTPNAVARIAAYCRSAVAASAAGFDIVHAELGGGSLGEFYAALVVCRQRSQPLPVCLTLHAPPRAIWWPFHFECIRERQVLRGAVALGLRHPARELESLLIRSAGHVFVLSEAARAAVRAGIGSAKPEISVIPFTAPAERIPAATAACSDPARPLVVGFFGYWYRSKSIEDLLAALAMLRAEQPAVRARLWGVALPSGGRAAAGYRATILRQIEALALGSLVELRGWVEEDAVPAELGPCDAIVLPYRLPRTVTGLVSSSAAARDALGAGVPVIAAATGPMAELVTHGDNGLLFEPGDQAELARHLRALRDDPALRRRLREGAMRSRAQLAQQSPGPVVASTYARLIGS